MPATSSSCRTGPRWLALALLLLGCRQPNPDWMGPVGSDGGDGPVLPLPTADGGTDTTGTGTDTGGEIDCTALDNRNDCNAAPGCAWTGNPVMGECKPA